LLKIISGGQTGVDRGALDAALELGVACGGWCPAGRLAEDGQIPLRYPMVELPNASYSERTKRNVSDADGTLIICKGELTGGTRETIEFCREMEKPHLVIDAEVVSSDEAVTLIQQFIFGHCIDILNVAGPRPSQWTEAHEITHQITSAVLRRLSGHEGGDEYSRSDSPRGEF
jgi:Circularly permutated YpsA SLOG family